MDSSSEKMSVEDVKRAFTGFVALVRLHDATYERDGITYLVPEWLNWAPVPYFEPNECCCENSCGVPDSCRLETKYAKGSHGWSMCRKCAGSWSEDYEVILPDLT